MAAPYHCLTDSFQSRVKRAGIVKNELYRDKTHSLIPLKRMEKTMLEPILYERQPESSLRDVLFVLFRHKKRAFIFFGTVFTIVALATFLSPEMYQSTSKLMIRLGRESVTLDPTASTGQTVAVYQDRKLEINSELEILKSRDLAEKVVDAIGVDVLLKKPDEIIFNEATPLGMTRDTVRMARKTVRTAAEKPHKILEKLDLADDIKKRDRAITQLSKDMEIAVSKESNIISISYEARTPQLARAVVSRLIDSYLEKHVDVYYSSGSYDFFTQQTRNLQENLVTIEEDIRKVKNDTGIASLGEQRTIALNRMGMLQQEIERNDASLAASQARINSLEETMRRIPSTVEVEKTSGFSNMAADNMRAQLYALQLREQDLLSKYTEENEQVREVRRQIVEAKSVLEEENPALTQTRSAINDAYKESELNLLSERANLESLRANGMALRSLLRDVTGEIRGINNNETQIMQLEREREIQEANYRKYSENLEQARIDQAMQMEKLSNIKVVQPATSPIKPIRPKKLLNLALGLFLGLIGGIGLAFTSEYVDHTFKRPDDIEKYLDIPLLASISDFSNTQKLLQPSERKIPRARLR